MRPGVAGEQPVERSGGGTQERRRDADRRRDPDAVAIARDILDREPAFVAGHPGSDGPSGGCELIEPRPGGRVAAIGPGRHLGGGQVAEPAQEVGDPVERRRPTVVGQRLEAQLEVGQRIGIEQLSQLLLAEQLTEQVAIERQRPGPTLGDRRVAVIHVGGHVVEHQAAGERRRSRRFDAVDGDLAAGDAGQDLAQAGQVEDIRQTLAIGLDQDRERAVPRGDGEQVRRALPLLPERRPRSRPPARQEQGPGRVLAEPAGEEGRGRELPDDEVLDLVRLREEERLDAGKRGIALGQADRDPIVRPDGLHLESKAFADPRLERERPRRVDPATERAQDAQPPIAELVAEPLDNDPLVRWQGSGRLALVVEIGEQVVGRARIEIVRLAQSRGRVAAALRATSQVALELGDEGAERTPELDRPSDRIAMPERQLARDARCGADGDPIMADLLDPPAAGAKHHDVTVHPGPEFVDHLLVELADAPTGRPGFARP